MIFDQISMGNLHVDIGTERVLRLCKCLSTNKAKVNLSYSHYFRHRSCYVTKFLNVSLRSGSLFREKNSEERKGKVSFPLDQRPVHRLSECRTYIFHLTIIVQLIKLIPPITEDSCLRILNNLALFVLR